MTHYRSIQMKLGRIVACSALIGMIGAGISGCATLQPQAAGVNSNYYGVPATERTLAQRILDRSIRNTALQNINALDPTLHQRSRISVDSFYSNVLLTGEVPDAATQQHIVNLVSAMPDVRQVHDGLNVSPNKGASYTVHDGFITSKINTKILNNQLIKSSQVKVVTDDGVVYVLGKLTPSQRGHLMNMVDSTVGVRKLILLTELVDDNGLPLDESLVAQEAGLAPPSYVADQVVYTDVATHIPVFTLPQTPNATSPAAGQPTVNQPAVNQPAANQPIWTPPTTPTPPVGTETSSPYIELYKDEVPGW